MPSDARRYPQGWEVFSQSIRQERAQSRCECQGECGLHRTHPGPRRCEEVNYQPAKWAHGRIILTVAHLCTCEPLCAEASHVKAMCQRCHLRIDRELHARHAAETRRRRREAGGQTSFLEPPPCPEPSSTG
jgi:hypothetical protein